MNHSSSVLGPVDPSSVNSQESTEKEKSAPWVVRKLIGSMTGRIVMSSYESLRAAGTSVVCLSPGGMAAVAAPVMGPVSEVMLGSFGDSIIVELGLGAGFDLGVKAANDLVFEKPLNHILPVHSRRLETTSIKTMLITLKYHHVVEDAALGFFRSSVHRDVSLFASVKDYLATEKGWFSPYLFASARRPIIPRSMKPDVVFCHGPFLLGDYRIGETLLVQSALVITFCEPNDASSPSSSSHDSAATAASQPQSAEQTKESRHSFPSLTLSNLFSRSRTPSPEPALAPVPAPPLPRRLAVLLVGLKPHRALWTSSARPGESVINYVLCNGCPAIVLPAKPGAPLVAWDGLTLKQLWKLSLPPPEDAGGQGAESPDGRFEGVVGVICEYLELCVDWGRMVVSGAATGDSSNGGDGEGQDDKKSVLRDAVALLVAGAVRTQTSTEVRKEIDEDRCGIAIWRIA